MKRLVIDDLRTATFDADHARTSLQALAALDGRTTYDEVYFDHDLGGNDTTIPVAEYLETLYRIEDTLPLKKAFVHTANPVGQQNLVRILERLPIEVEVIWDALEAGLRF